MTFTHLIKTRAPKYCGVHPSFGEIGILVKEAEEFGAPEFAASAFDTPRERALIFAPYEAQAILGTYPEVINLIEYAICQHRQTDHGEDYAERIKELTEELGENPKILEGESLEVGTLGWWNA